ncbi:MAG: hypothetical protein H6935_01790 [Thiobacillus sp.]|nr:hypothetical protein [Thiobacillus sp.]
MRYVDLDFLHPRPRPSLAAWVLLAVGIGLAAMVFFQHQALDGNIAREEGLARKLKADTAQASRSGRKAGVSQQVTAAEVKARLTTPWGALLDKLERTSRGKIALLSLEADDRRREASITAEARSAEDMLAYLEQLKQEAGMDGVVLSSHKILEEDAQRPIRFVLRLEWRR